ELAGDPGEPHGAVEPVVIGDGEAVQPEPDRFGDEVLGVAGPVEEGEVRVAVELGVDGLPGPRRPPPDDGRARRPDLPLRPRPALPRRPLRHRPPPTTAHTNRRSSPRPSRDQARRFGPATPTSLQLAFLFRWEAGNERRFVERRSVIDGLEVSLAALDRDQAGDAGGDDLPQGTAAAG